MGNPKFWQKKGADEEPPRTRWCVPGCACGCQSSCCGCREPGLKAAAAKLWAPPPCTCDFDDRGCAHTEALTHATT